MATAELDDFQEMLLAQALNEDQQKICAEIRTSEKNKVAARNYRLRQNNLISDLKEKVSIAVNKELDLDVQIANIASEEQDRLSEVSKLTVELLRKYHYDPDYYTVICYGENIQIVPKDG